MTGHVEDEPGNGCDHNSDPYQVGDHQESSGSQVGVGCDIAAQRGRIGHDQVQTINDFHHCQSGNEGRYAQESDEGAGHGTEACAYQHNDDGCQEDVHRLSALNETSRVVSLLQQDACKAAAETDQTTCGQVAACGDNAARDAQCDDKTCGHVQKQVHQVGRRHEVGGLDAGEDNQDDDDKNNAVVNQEILDIKCFFVH